MLTTAGSTRRTSGAKLRGIGWAMEEGAGKPRASAAARPPSRRKPPRRRIRSGEELVMHGLSGEAQKMASRPPHLKMNALRTDTQVFP
jgi:hypothetical protein